MGVKERKARAKENLRREILDAARELFAAEGYENVSMRRIADKIEYSPTTIYLYFKDKAELVQEICEETFAKLIKKFERLRRAHPDPLECLQKCMQTYVEFALQNPSHYEVTFIMAMQDQHEAQDAYQFHGSLGEQSFKHLRELVAECMEQGVLENNDVELVSQGIWACGHGVASLLIMHTDFPFVERKALIEHVGTTIVRGLLAAPKKAVTKRR
jgi:AcrR family transcriptional regulator